MAAAQDALVPIIAEEAGGPAVPAVAAIAEAARRRHGEGILAVLFYGSVLRDQDIEGRIVDLYLLAESYDSLHRGAFTRAMNAALPPNVYYLETDFEGRRVRAKYALMTLAQFEKAVSPATFHSYFWARFAQPATVVWHKDASSRERLLRALAGAVGTLVQSAWPLFEAAPESRAFWERAFSETYRSELRAERKGRAAQIYTANAARYDRLLQAIPAASRGPLGRGVRRRAALAWWGRRVAGKLLSVLRLIKAAFTFQDGADYLAWKIKRHSGVELELTPWQRRHPILAAPVLFWSLYFRGAFR